MMRYLPARHYLSFGIVAFALAIFSGWLGLGWMPGFIPCALFLVSGAALIYMAYRPAIEIHRTGRNQALPPVASPPRWMISPGDRRTRSLLCRRR